MLGEVHIGGFDGNHICGQNIRAFFPREINYFLIQKLSMVLAHKHGCHEIPLLILVNLNEVQQMINHCGYSLASIFLLRLDSRLYYVTYIRFLRL